MASLDSRMVYLNITDFILKVSRISEENGNVYRPALNKVTQKENRVYMF